MADQPKRTNSISYCRYDIPNYKTQRHRVTRSEQYLDSVASRGGDGTDSLSALRLLALQRRAFVQIARDYNERIARYSELASPGQLSAGRLTGMLINTGIGHGDKGCVSRAATATAIEQRYIASAANICSGFAASGDSER